MQGAWKRQQTMLKLRAGRDWASACMIRISTIFIAICMVLVAASLGLVLYSLAGSAAPNPRSWR